MTTGSSPPIVETGQGSSPPNGSQPEPSVLGKTLFLALGMAAGAGVAMAVYRRPLETALLWQRLKLYTLGLRSYERFTAGTRVRYWVGGEDSPIAIVFLHGPFAASETWHGVLPRVARTFRVIAPDLPGFGRSPDPVDASVAYLGRVLATLLDEEGVDGAILVGSSLGGLVALETALAYPRLVRGLVLEDVMGLAGELPDDALLVHGGRQDVDELLRKAWSEPPPMPAFVKDQIVIRSHRASLRALLQDVPHAGRRIEASLPRIAVPTLILWGEADGLCGLDQGERCNALISGSRLVPFTRCGHLPHVEAQELFHEELMDFLAGPTPEIPEAYEI